MQLFIIALGVLQTISWSSDATLEAAYALQGNAYCMTAAAAFLIASFFLRCSMYIRPRLLLVMTILLFTLSGTFVLCCLSSILVCSSSELFSDHCRCNAESTVRGQNAVYISISLLVLSFFTIHYAIHRSTNTKGMVMDTIARNTMLIMFVSCASVCVIDDNIWDWKYAFAFLFTLGLTTYINTLSAFVFHSNETDNDAWQLVGLVYLQPFLFIEDSLKACLSPVG